MTAQMIMNTILKIKKEIDKMKQFNMRYINRDLDAYAISFMGLHPEIELRITPDSILFGHDIYMAEKPFEKHDWPKEVRGHVSAEHYSTPRAYELGVIAQVNLLFKKLTHNQIIGQICLFQEELA